MSPTIVQHHAKRLAYPVALLGWLFVGSLISSRAQAGAEFGIDRSNLTRETEAVQEKALQDIYALHATWFRDVLSGTTPQGIAKFVNEVKLAKQNNLKLLANVLAAQADYDEGYQNQNAGEDFRKRCGWPQGSSQLSQINQAKLSQRLRMQFDAVKGAGLTIDAFEIGNEVDWICFNGDVPDGHAPSEAELLTAVRGYAHFLKTAAEVIHDPHYFPNAKIITFGIAHGSDRWDRPPHHFADPARMISMLRNLDGFNYLDNGLYHVDGYGTHIYPDPDNLAQSVTGLVHQDAAILGPDKPFWITEWGLASNRFPNKQGQTRSQVFKDFYDTLEALDVPLGPPFYYAHSPGGSSLIDASGTLLPEARALALRGGKQSFGLVPAEEGDALSEADGVIVGVNVTNNDGSLSASFQDEEIKQLTESHVTTMRVGLVSYNIDFIVKAYQHGIRSVVIVLPFLGLKGWSDVVYSRTTPEVFTERVKPMLEKLEAAGVRLTAFELGNEINNSQFNGDLPTVGKGRELGLADLNNPNDPQATQVATGFKAYVRLMAALKDLRDHSRVNRQTPLISAGLSQVHSTPFEVTLRDALEFLNQNGMDKLVDGYGIHVYPSGDPNRPVSARIASLDEGMFSACSLKPCWVTEWGFQNDGQDGQYCPGNNPVLTKVVQDMRMAFTHFATHGHLAALVYFDWTARPGAKDTFSVYRCGALTDAGKLALNPM